MDTTNHPLLPVGSTTEKTGPLCQVLGASAVFPQGSTLAKREAEGEVCCRSCVSSGLCLSMLTFQRGPSSSAAPQGLAVAAARSGFRTCLCLGQIRPQSCPITQSAGLGLPTPRRAGQPGPSISVAPDPRSLSWGLPALADARILCQRAMVR